jgi:hypothetical protein
MPLLSGPGLCFQPESLTDWDRTEIPSGRGPADGAVQPLPSQASSVELGSSPKSVR